MTLDNLIFKDIEDSRSKINYYEKVKYLQKIDPVLLKKLLNEYEDIKMRISNSIAKESGGHVILELIKDEINKMNLTPPRNEIISLWMNGYTELEISTLTHVTRNAIHMYLKRFCIKLSAILERELKINFMMENKFSD